MAVLSIRTLQCGGIAQLVERLVRNEKARGSNPLTSTNLASGEIALRLVRRSTGGGSLESKAGDSFRSLE